MPEVASRHQLEALIPVLESAFAEAGAGWDAIDAIAATYGPGLAGSLLVGLTAGKTLALARGLPFLGVNHLEAHIYANWLRTGEHEQADPAFPLLALVVSGAHTELVYIAEHGHYELMGQTRDDAAGEAFDKVARLLGLGYPGGPAIQQAAAERDPARPNPYTLPRAWLPGTWDFSFSGLKTATRQLLRERRARTADSDRHPRSGRRVSGCGGGCAGDQDGARRRGAWRAPGLAGGRCRGQRRAARATDG